MIWYQARIWEYAFHKKSQTKNCRPGEKTVKNYPDMLYNVDISQNASVEKPSQSSKNLIMPND